MPDINGPKVRLGVVWFVAAVSASASSPPLFAVLMSLAAAAAADEVVRIQVGARRWPVVLAGAVLPVAALGGTSRLLAGAAAVCGLVAVGTLLGPGRHRGVEELAAAIVAPLALGMAAAAPVLVERIGVGAAVTMVVLVSAYEAGDFTFGAGAAARWEGPMAGIVAVGVCAFAVWVIDAAPLGQDGVVWLAATIALLGPLGPPLGSVLLGSASQPGRYVRRLDTLVAAGPLAAWVVAHVVHPA